MKHFFIIASFAALFFGCKVDPKIVVANSPIQEVLPDGWPKPVYTFSNNPLSEAKFQLGRALFYDPILSIDSTVSCASCHQDFAAFANAGHQLSHGIKELNGNRNAPPLFNLNWHPYFMHDGGINHIEVQPLGPISNTVEMGENIGHVITKLQRSARYRNLFGSDEINSQNMLKAMAQFMGMLYSYNSKYDQVKKSGAQQSFTGSEFHGYQLFLTNCNGCHKEPLFSDFQFRSNGLKVNPALNDSGRAHITGLSTDKFKFKTPSLRNIALTAPYMHDGRFENLDSVLNYYTRAFENTQNLDAQLPAGGFQFSATDKKDIINFLKTLSDTALINNARFKDPKHF